MGTTHFIILQVLIYQKRRENYIIIRVLIEHGTGGNCDNAGRWTVVLVA